MERRSDGDIGREGWNWFDIDVDRKAAIDDDDLVRSFTRCFKGSDGAMVLQHLRQTILDRRLGPGSSDAELRFLEGQRTVVAHILSMVDRGKG